MSGFYELVRLRIAAHAPIAALQVVTANRRKRRRSSSDSPQRQRERNRKWYGINRQKAISKVTKAHEAFKAKWGFWPSTWYYWKKKLDKGLITAGQLPKKFVPLFIELKRKGKI